MKQKKGKREYCAIQVRRCRCRNQRIYTIRVKESDEHKADQIQYMTDSGTIYTFSESIFLKDVTFDKHLYRPLLVLKDNEISMTPASLNKGEKSRKLRSDVTFCLYIDYL